MIERTSLIDPLLVIIVPLLWLSVAVSFNEISKFFNAVAAKIEYFSAKFDVYDDESLSDSCCGCCCKRFNSLSVG